MADPTQVEILKRGVEEWNRWRDRNQEIGQDIWLDLSGSDLSGSDLSGVNLIAVNLSEALLVGSDLSRTLCAGARFFGADLRGANLRTAFLLQADLCEANLEGANLEEAILAEANLTGAKLNRTHFEKAQVGFTVFGNVDLRLALGLDEVIHEGPSTIGVDTLYRSGGQIPEAFLRGAGVPESFIAYARDLVVKPIELYSCFISYSSKNDEFAQRLYSRLQQDHARVFFAQKDLQAGKKTHEQIYGALRACEKFLLVLSPNSMASEWVTTEIRRARKLEKETGRRKLFPIRLCDFDALRDWEAFDADTGQDLAVEIREYFIPDFSTWKDHDAFEAAYDKLKRDLRLDQAEEPPAAGA